jgi:hypothetical protein
MGSIPGQVRSGQVRGQTKSYNIGIDYFTIKHAASRSKSKDWLPGKQDNVYLWTVVTVS